MAKFPGLILFAVLSLFPSMVDANGIEKGTKTSLSRVPSNAIAFVHVKIRELGRTSGLSIPSKIFSEIAEDADQLFEHHFGVRISQLNDLTFVVPNVDSIASFQANGAMPGFFLFTFGQGVSEEIVAGRLPESWQQRTISGTKIYTDGIQSMGLAVCSSNTIAFGSSASINWLVQHAQNESGPNGMQSAMAFAKTGHIAIGINGGSIPDEMKGLLPNDLSFFANATFAALSIDMAKGIQMHAKLGFAEKAKTDLASNFVKQWIGYGKAVLVEEESVAAEALVEQFDDFESALAPLASIGLIRFGQSILDRVEIKESSQTLELVCGLDGVDSNMLIISSLAAIQAIGVSANEKFESVVEQLE